MILPEKHLRVLSSLVEGCHFAANAADLQQKGWYADPDRNIEPHAHWLQSPITVT
jgi:hypothetical protein